ncbi:MAG: FIST C-terminal domain-containing protein [Candidatus Omnitrophica bacterium]|nr:FIST C-terminal domain-containing protein [Candidatus Omnitrophota bacterium]
MGVGSSKKADSYQAGREAAAQAISHMGLSSADFAFVFASARFDPEALLKGIRSVTKEAALVGCSTAGEITSEGPAKRSVVIMAVQSDKLTATPGIGLRLDATPRETGEEAAWGPSRAKVPSPHLFLMFPDGVSGNVAEALRGVQTTLGRSFPIAGGASGDDFLFKKTYQYHNDKVYSNAVAGSLLAGPISIGIGARHGWRPLGKPRLVTRAMANVVRELDGKSAVNIYQEYFGKGAQELTRESLARMSIIYPLGMPIEGEEEYLLRNVLKMTPQGDLVYTGEVPEGSSVRLMMGSKKHALTAARVAAERAMISLRNKAPRLALVFSSASRARLFGRGAEAEIKCIQAVVGRKVPLAGFYGYGEIAPLSSERYLGQAHYHNETLVVLVIAE